MQTWSNLIKYIKARLGVPVNFLELSDEDIIDYIKEHTIPELSTVLAKNVLIKVTQDDRIDTNSGYEYEYAIPLKDDCEIIDVYSVYINENNVPLYQLAYTYLYLDPRDLGMQNEMIMSIKSLQTVQEYQFYPPNIIRFGTPVRGMGFFAECRCIFKDPREIPADYYHKFLKRKALADIMLLVASMRKKYDGLTTPFGQINLNWQEMEANARDILTQIESELDAMPPEYLIAWIND